MESDVFWASDLFLQSNLCYCLQLNGRNLTPFYISFNCQPDTNAWEESLNEKLFASHWPVGLLWGIVLIVN